MTRREKVADWVRKLTRRRPLVAVVPLVGAIGVGGRLHHGLTLAGLEPRLDQAFALKGLKAVALAINSPGGAPVQSMLIATRIRALAAEKKLPVIAFCEDVAASGGYILALAGDEIIAHPSSLVGSIGVVSAGFGFPGLLEKLGVERRVHAAGDRKAMLDPFQPEKKEDVARLEAIQKMLHDQFKALVVERRGAKLPRAKKPLFSGDVWLGEKALDLGLVDGLGDLRTVMRARFGDKTRFKVLGGERNWLRRRLGLKAGSGLAAGLIGDAEERALWARFGL